MGQLKKLRKQANNKRLRILGERKREGPRLSKKEMQQQRAAAGQSSEQPEQYRLIYSTGQPKKTKPAPAPPEPEPEPDEPEPAEEEDDEEDDWRKRKKRKKKPTGEQSRPGLPGRPDHAIVFARRFWGGEPGDCSGCPEVAAARERIGVRVLAGAEYCPGPVASWADPRLPSVVRAAMEVVSRQSGGQISSPSPVQAQAWPAALTGHDLVAIAETGSGKTLGYLLPAVPHVQAALSRLVPAGAARRPQIAPVALVLVPTRELANQVVKAARVLRTQGVRAVAVYGGEGKKLQLDRLEEGCDLLVATPGRLLELLECRQVELSWVRMLVLDEADKMLELGFEKQLDNISGVIRLDRQTLLFSATLAPKLSRATGRWLHQPIQLELGAGPVTLSQSTRQIVQVLPGPGKLPAVRKLLAALDKRERAERAKSRVLVFVNRVEAADKLAAQLESQLPGLVQPLHGKLQQSTREARLSEFKSGKLRVLVSTDVAARGIHVSKLPVVVNFDFPISLEQFAHRVGRTGRQGQPGLAYTLVCPETDGGMAAGLARLLRQAGQPVSNPLAALAELHPAADENPEPEAE